MNNVTATNVSLLFGGIAALTTAVDLAVKANYLGAVIAVVVGVIFLIAYEKTPPSPPAI